MIKTQISKYSIRYLEIDNGLSTSELSNKILEKRSQNKQWSYS